MFKYFFIALLLFSMFSCKTTKVNKEQVSESDTTTKVVTGNELIDNPQKRDQDLINKGYDFFAMGMNPFWTFNVDFDNHTAVLVFGGTDVYNFMLPELPEKFFNEIHLVNESKSVNVRMEEISCYNVLSGEGFIYTVYLDFEGNSYKACGKYLEQDIGVGNIDPLLFNTWSLVQMKEKDIGEINRPTLTLSGSDNKASGFASCNQYNGSYKLTQDIIQFGHWAMTRKYCKESIEVEYMKLLGEVYSYFIENKSLSLLDYNGKILLKYKIVE